MKDIVISVNSNDSTVKLNTLILGVRGENLQRRIIVEFTESFVDGTATLEYKRKSGEKGSFALTKDGEAYAELVDSKLTAETPTIKCQVKVVQESTDKGTPIFKSKVFELTILESIDEEI